MSFKGKYILWLKKLKIKTFPLHHLFMSSAGTLISIYVKYKHICRLGIHVTIKLFQVSVAINDMKLTHPIQTKITVKVGHMLQLVQGYLM